MIIQGSPDTRAMAGGALGLLAIWAGLAKYPVLVHGVVLSIFPPTVARALVVLTVCSAVAATALGLGFLGYAVDRAPERINASSVGMSGESETL